MLKCLICDTNLLDTIKHNNHLKSKTHKNKCKKFKAELEMLSSIELEEKYNNENIYEIISNHENISENKEITNLLNITNKDGLRFKIHEIHNFLRNHGAGYGMNALKVFNVFYGLKRIEDSNLLEAVGLTEEHCKFSYLLKLANENKAEELTGTIFQNTLRSIHNNPKCNFFFHKLPNHIKSTTFEHLIREIQSLTDIEKTCNVHLSGKVYEYFIGRDDSAISELGAYFTDRHIIDFINEEEPVEIIDGMVPTMIDPFGGSGGFTIGYINHIIEQNQQVNWQTELNKIYHLDMNEDVIKSAALEFLCLTNVFPNTNNNVICKNSFTNEFSDMSFKQIRTNPPYGGDKSKKNDHQIKRDKIKAYINKELKTLQDENLIQKRNIQLELIKREEKKEKIEYEKQTVSLDTSSARINKFAKKYKITNANDKEACSLILIMDLLDVGGTAIGVLKEGVFFNSKYKNLRKVLLENYNVRKVISVPSDQFENTTTKTSIIVFDNIETKTSVVEFSSLIVEKYDDDVFDMDENGFINLIESKDDIKSVYKEITTYATIHDILQNENYSLDGKEYNRKELIVGDEYELVRLGNLCEFLPKSNRNASFGKSEGQFNFYTSSEKVKKCDIADYNEECLIIGNGGVANIKIDNMFSCSDHHFIIKTKYNKYIYSIFKGSINLLSDGFTGSTLRNLSKDYLKNIPIPIPKSQDRIDYWVNRISEPWNEMNSKKQQLEELENEIKERIRYITENEECDEVRLDSLCEYIKTGKNKTPDNKQGTLYPYYGTADITGYTDYYLYDGKHILVARNGTMGNCFLVEGKVYPSDHIFVIKNNNNISIEMLYYLIKSLSNKIQNSSNGTIIQGISKINLSKITLRIPKNKQLIEDLEPHFNQIEQLNKDIKIAEETYNQSIQELKSEAIKSN